MKNKVGHIVGWTCAILVAAWTIFSGAMAFLVPMDTPETVAYVARLGITGMVQILAIAKIIIAILFLIPRTSTVGFVLIIGYFGGVLATNITHDIPFAEYAPILVVFLLLTISAWFRNPELTARLRGKLA